MSTHDRAEARTHDQQRNGAFKAPLCKGSWRQRRLRDCFTMKFLLLQSLRLASQATSADYNNKCNTRKKYRQYSHQGVKCSHHNKQLHGGKNIVLHTFYTIWARKSTVFLKSRKKFSRNCKNYGQNSLHNQSRSQKELEQKGKPLPLLACANKLQASSQGLSSQKQFATQ